MPSTTSSHDSESTIDTVEPDESDQPDGGDPRRTLCERLGYRFDDDALLELALRHRSWCAENGAVASNERLEFLGDAVLGLVVTDHLFRTSPGSSEGVLARRRSELVSATALAGVAATIGLGDALLLGKGEEATGGRGKTSILADAMESVLGAVYLDRGIEAATDVVLGLLQQRIDGVVAGDVASDHKSRLQEVAAHRFGELPRYELSEDGPEHEKRFRAVVRLGGADWGEGEGRTKKEAEQAAAREATDRLDRDAPDQDGADGSATGRSAAAPGPDHEGLHGGDEHAAASTRGDHDA